MSISDTDWELLNAYADQELSSEEEHMVRSRIARDAALRDALSQIQEMKRHIRGSFTDQIEQAKPARTMGRWQNMAAAAAIALALGSGVFGWQSFQNFQRLNPEAIHQQYSGKSYMIEGPVRKVQVYSMVAGDFTIPDLGPSELELAEASLNTIDGKEVLSAHYRGMRGCRLTLVSVGEKSEHAARHSGVAFSQIDQLLKASWTTATTSFTVLATGMDENRFTAIAHFLKSDIQNQNLQKQEDLRLAMEKTYREARPCA